MESVKPGRITVQLRRQGWHGWRAFFGHRRSEVPKLHRLAMWAGPVKVVVWWPQQKDQDNG
jgi:hypothetical protein